MIYNFKGIEFHVDNGLYRQLEKVKVKNLKKKDNHKLILVCGHPGVGKSVLTMQMAAVADDKFSVENMAFTKNQMTQKLKTKPGSALIFDEAFRGISSRNTMDKEQKALLQMLYEIRQLNQCIFFATPSFFRLDEAVAVELADALVYVYKSGKSRRFKFFNKRKKDQLYYKAKKFKSYGLVGTGLRGKFYNHYVIPEDLYRRQKFESLFGKLDDSDKGDPRVEKARYREAQLFAALVKVGGSYGKAIKLAKLANLTLDKSTIHGKIARYPDLMQVVVAQ